MPRNLSGDYNLPSGNPVQPNTLITTGWANPTLSDIAASMTESLDRYGRGGMLAPFKVTDGSISAPGLGFQSESSTGLYRIGAGDVAMAVTGIKVQEWLANGVTVTPPMTLGGTLHVLGATTLDGAMNLSGAIGLPAGSVAAPALSFTADPDTGIYWAGANNLAVSVGGTPTLSVSPGATGITGSLSVSGGIGAANLSTTGGISAGAAMSVAVPDGTTLKNGIYLESNAANPGNFSPAIAFSGSNINAQIFSQRYSGYGGDLVFATQNQGYTGSPTAKMLIQSDGNVGIGMTNPLARLHVVSGTGEIARFAATTPTSYLTLMRNSVDVAGYIGTGDILGAVASDLCMRSVNNLLFGTGNAAPARMSIDAVGNVGIGTLAYGLPASSWLHLRKDSTTWAGSPVLTIENRGTTGAVVTDAPVGGIAFASYRDVMQPSYLAGIYAYSYGFPGNYGYLTFHTIQNGPSTPFMNSEKMRIDWSGNLMLGTKAPAYAIGGRTCFEINGASSSLIGFQVGGVQKGYVYHTGADLLVVNEPVGRVQIGNGGNLALTVYSGKVGINYDPQAQGQTQALYVMAPGAMPGLNVACTATSAMTAETMIGNFTNLQDADFNIKLSTAGAAPGSRYVQIGPSTGGTYLIFQTANAMRASIDGAGAFNLISGSGKFLIAGLPSRFESGEVPLPTSTTYVSFGSHGQNRPPDVYTVVLRCKVASNGYAVGDELLIKNDIGTVSREFWTWANASGIAFGWWTNAPPQNVAIRDTGGTLTQVVAGNWRLVVRCLWL